MERLLKAYIDYLEKAFEEEANAEEAAQALKSGAVGLAYTELGGYNEYPVQVELLASALALNYYVADELKLTEHYNSIDELSAVLEGASFEGLIETFYNLIPEE